jgi:hypothetical protein
LGANDKLEWLLQKDLLYAYGSRHEVFRLLAQAYPLASERSQVALLNRVRFGPQGEGDRDIEEDARAYEIYNLLVWLHRAAPNSPPTTERFEEMQRTHGDDFEPREHPDLSSYIYRLASPRSPITTEELLSSNIGDVIDLLLSFQGDVSERTTRGSLIETVGEAVARSYPFGRSCRPLCEIGENGARTCGAPCSGVGVKEDFPKSSGRVCSPF